MHFYRNFSPEDYVKLLANASCIVGNSSSGLREGAFLGTPCVNIGSRQSGRERAENVIDVDYNSEAISSALAQQLAHGPYSSSHLVGDGSAGRKIADILANSEFCIQKRLSYTNES